MKEHRLRKIFNTDRRTVIIACDHAMFNGPLPGLEDPGSLLDTLVSTGVDAVLTTFGVAQKYAARMGRLGLILRMDGGSSSRSPQMGMLRNQYGLKEAAALGADAVICMGMIGFQEEPASLANLAELACQSLEWNIPVVAEMLVCPPEKGGLTPADVGFAMRIGAEMGADIIKTSYAAPRDEFARALDGCYCPVVVLGGEKAKDETAVLASVAESLDCGASGVAMGRNVWQNANPAGFCRALIALVHSGASVDQAVKELKA